MIFAVLDPSPLTVCIKCSFFTFIFAVLLPVLSRLLIMSIRPTTTFFRFFQDGGRPPSWICNACVGTTHEGHLVVFITVENVVGIDAVVLIICTLFDFASLA